MLTDTEIIETVRGIEAYDREVERLALELRDLNDRHQFICDRISEQKNLRAELYKKLLPHLDVWRG